ncbi:hypothetical protein Ciccas_004122 [Cichlidogyrus casuarinus]|uniref:Uncharacterized protein n=1 Tax=Cichlidogyrus casuarinus TaxID=1844966 RepID=A0ABD2QFT5_9PLAT
MTTIPSSRIVSPSHVHYSPAPAPDCKTASFTAPNNANGIIHHPPSTSVVALLKATNPKAVDSPPTPPVVLPSGMGASDLGMLAAAAALDTVTTASSACSSNTLPVLPPKLKDSTAFISYQLHF